MCLENCEDCSNYRSRIIRLERYIGELKEERSELYESKDQLCSIKAERDELKKASDHSYDCYVSNPYENNNCEDCDMLTDTCDALKGYARIPFFGRAAQRTLDDIL